MSKQEQVLQDVVIKFAGDSGDGMQLTGQQFTNNSNGGYYSAGGDSVYTVQKWFWIDNKLLLNGYLGKENKKVTKKKLQGKIQLTMEKG